jgi:hypothetical protein
MLGGVALATFLVLAASTLLQGQPLSDLWPGYSQPLTWVVLLWSALGPGALAAYFHVKVSHDYSGQLLLRGLPAGCSCLAGPEVLSMVGLVG